MGKIEKLVEEFLRDPPEVQFIVPDAFLSLGVERCYDDRGSHHTFRNEDGLKITVPKKGGRMVKAVYVQQIVKLLNLEESSDENQD